MTKAENDVEGNVDKDDGVAERDEVGENVPDHPVPRNLVGSMRKESDSRPEQQKSRKTAGTPPGTPPPRVISAPSSMVAMAQRLSEEPPSPMSPSTEERRNVSPSSLEIPISPPLLRVREAFRIIR